MSNLAEKLSALPRLGVGISGEFGSAAKGIDALWLRSQYPELIHFFEYGSDIDRGLDEHARNWAAAGLPCTYHFLDINIEEKIDLTDQWLASTLSLARQMNAVWLCGDAGRWHFGARERGHQMLMPPILCQESLDESAQNIERIQQQTGLLCLPENPPAVIYLGDMHILDYFAELSEKAQCGLLLDCAHLAIFQYSRGLSPLAGLDRFPLDRVVEMHIAGGALAEVSGFKYIEDSHSPDPIDAAWQILEYVAPRAANLRAIVYECELNAPEECLNNFTRLNKLFPASIDLIESIK
jgi:uncharacterized protein (UPF0276 family)